MIFIFSLNSSKISLLIKLKLLEIIIYISSFNRLPRAMYKPEFNIKNHKNTFINRKHN